MPTIPRREHSDHTKHHTGRTVSELVPDLNTDISVDRLHHRDIGIMTPEQRWAERWFIERELASAIYNRHRPTVFHVDAHGHVLTDFEWLRERFTRLRDRTRQSAAA